MFTYGLVTCYELLLLKVTTVDIFLVSVKLSDFWTEIFMLLAVWQ